MKDFKFAEICKYVTMTDTVIYPFAVVMNIDKWNSLPKNIQMVMEDLGTEQAEWTGNYMDNHVKEAIVWSQKEQNVEIIQLPQQEMAKWNKMLEPIITDWVKDSQTKGVPAEEIVKDIRALAKKHSQ